ncbi:hypothetical protein [Halopelagius fulvigenes]|uniref:MBL fold metallo-hydrolase n=1 Tax=Halopelagius fulvigenes TaxID=1198324 RepID=A0ABD5TY64_9EURY
MTVYDRSSSAGLERIDEWDGGVGWLSHPEEAGRRASHAVRGSDGGVWLLDPIDAPGADELASELGEVVGVAVCSNWHARDAGAFARRHDVPVYLPRWMDRIEDRVDAEIRRYDRELGDSGFRVSRLDPLPGWREAVAYRESDGTLYVPDVMSSVEGTPVGEERIGLFLTARLSPPRETFAAFDPERIVFGHGTGCFEDAAAALDTALDGARRRFPRALLRSGPEQLRGLVDALRD